MRQIMTYTRLVLIGLIFANAYACKPEFAEDSGSSIYEATATGFRFSATLNMTAEGLVFRGNAATGEKYRLLKVQQSSDRINAGRATKNQPTVIVPKFDLTIEGPDGDNCFAAAATASSGNVSADLSSSFNVECYSAELVCKGVGGTYTNSARTCTCPNKTTPSVDRALLDSIKGKTAELCKKKVVTTQQAQIKKEEVVPEFAKRCVEDYGGDMYYELDQAACHCRAEDGSLQTVHQMAVTENSNTNANGTPYNHFSRCKEGGAGAAALIRDKLMLDFTVACNSFQEADQRIQEPRDICPCDDGKIRKIDEFLTPDKSSINLVSFHQTCGIGNQEADLEPTSTPEPTAATDPNATGPDATDPDATTGTEAADAPEKPTDENDFADPNGFVDSSLFSD